METKIIKINPQIPEKAKVNAASNILKKGGLVVFPTETVYGLGANALDSNAVEKIFKAKGRPSDNPLIVHIAREVDILDIAEEIPENAKQLIDAFWPGPLTIVLKKRSKIPSIVTAGLDTVAIRMPKNRIAIELIKASGFPLAAPSANLSTKPSPTTAKDAILDMGGRVDAIIDGGRASVGIESTVVDLTCQPPKLLRPGKITLEDISNVIGEVQTHTIIQNKDQIKTVVVNSPGMKYKHYAPEAEVVLFELTCRDRKKRIQELSAKYQKMEKKVAIITLDRDHSYWANKVVFLGGDLNSIARNLFKEFRKLDQSKIDVIILEGVMSQGFGAAIMDRARRAARRIVKK